MKNKKIKPKKAEELPSFLRNLNYTPEEFDFNPKPAKSKQHLGPIFFGPCQLQPPLHVIDLGSSRHSQKNHLFRNTISDLFFPITDHPKKFSEKKFRLLKKHSTKLYPDPYPHKCLGSRKVFATEPQQNEIDLGETNSTIVGETSREIPLICVKRISSSMDDTIEELVLPSDVREKRIKEMPYNDRISHAHFLKEFVDVTLKGPTIPAAITITQIPSHRRKEPDYAFLRRKFKVCEKKEMKKTEELLEEMEEFENDVEEGQEDLEEMDDSEAEWTAEQEEEEMSDTSVKIKQMDETEQGTYEENQEDEVVNEMSEEPSEMMEDVTENEESEAGDVKEEDIGDTEEEEEETAENKVKTEVAAQEDAEEGATEAVED